MRNKSRANSDVSQLAEDMLGRRVASPDPVSGSRTRRRSSSVGESEGTAVAESPSVTEGGASHATSASLPATALASPNLDPARPEDASSRPESLYTSPRPFLRSSTLRPEISRPTSQGRSRRRERGFTNNGSMAFKGTIARATTDTTLAVIPAEAFRKLTRKFPKASGTVVQVVLERFSRVTFMTGQYPFGKSRERLTDSAQISRPHP